MMMRFFSFTIVQVLLLQHQSCVLEATSSNVSVRPSLTTTTTTASPPVFDVRVLRGGSQWKAPPRRKNAHFAASPTKNSNKAVVSSSSSKNVVSPSKSFMNTIISWSGQNKLALSLTAIVLAVAYRERQAWVPLVTDRERLQQETLRLLHKHLEPKDGAAVWKSLVVYATAMAVWEFGGLSTIPVETAAAMMFGWPALVASAAGKLTGASASFLVGRTLLQQWIKRHPSVQDNVVLQILQEEQSTGHSPLQTALFMKFSCFPELIKNMGSGAIISDEKLNFWAFLAATAFHGVGFTALWTWVGVESGRQLVDTTSSSSSSAAADAATLTTTAAAANSGVGMQVALLIAGVMGLILSPALMAWWIRDLRRMQKEHRQGKQRR